MKLKIWMSRKRLLVAACVLLAVLFAYLSFSSYEIYKINKENYRAENVDIIIERMNSLFLEINDFPQDEGDNMVYLGKLDSLNKFLNSNEIDKEYLREDIEMDFFIFAEVSPVYYQLRYIDETGLEIVRVDQDDEGVSIMGKDILQNKKTRPYFQKTMQLDREEIYVSPLDLNIEKGALENRGTKEDPEYVPVIRYAMPVFNDVGERKGIIISNVYADYFLEDIRRLGREEEFSLLIDNNGYYLAHPNRSKEFSFMFDGKNSFFSDYGEVSREILGGFDKRYIENEDYVFTFRYLYPTIGTFEIYQGARRLLGESPEKEYYWVLVSVSSKESLNLNLSYVRSESIAFVLISALIITVIVILLLMILAMNGNLDKR